MFILCLRHVQMPDTPASVYTDRPIALYLAQPTSQPIFRLSYHRHFVSPSLNHRSFILIHLRPPCHRVSTVLSEHCYFHKLSMSVLLRRLILLFISHPALFPVDTRHLLFTILYLFQFVSISVIWPRNASFPIGCIFPRYNTRHYYQKLR